MLRAAVDAIFEPTDYGAVTAILALPDAGEYTVVTDRVRVGASVEGTRRPIARRRRRRGPSQTGEQIVVGRLAASADAEDAQLAYQSALVTPVFDGPTTAAHRPLRPPPRPVRRRPTRTLMQTVAEQVAATLRGVRLRDESEQRSQRLALTTEVAGAIASAQTIDEVLAAVVETVHQGRGYSAAIAIRVHRRRASRSWWPTSATRARPHPACAGRSTPAPSGR